MAENAATKQRGKPFPKGTSGNPKGKPVGTRHKATRAALALLEGEGEALTRKAVEMALAGDTTALRLCLERIAPPAKDRTIDPDAVELPELLPENMIAASAAVLRSVVAGKLTPLEGVALAGLIEGHRKTIEIVDLETRLAALEAAQREKKR
ncbi:MAG: hypothetical protein FD177_2249 [Desulfovibrionaceae bacterium]|nr:MAG: hypothetical protein FD177_2249 [Desulfovibrionaceae bacterium]